MGREEGGVCVGREEGGRVCVLHVGKGGGRGRIWVCVCVGRREDRGEWRGGGSVCMKYLYIHSTESIKTIASTLKPIFTSRCNNATVSTAITVNTGNHSLCVWLLRGFTHCSPLAV